MLGNVTRRFLRSERGTAGLLFGLAAIPIVALAGGVVDYAFLENEREKLQQALDAGTLAAMHVDDLEAEEAREVILDYLKSNYRSNPRVKVDFEALEVSFRDTGGGSRVLSARVPATVRMAFLSLLGMSSQRIELQAEARDSIGGLEVVMVLDNTGSMSGRKIRELRRAAASLVDVLAEMADKAAWVKVGLVPYTSFVNVGRDKWNAWWLKQSCCRRGGVWPWWLASWRGRFGTSWEGVVGLRDGSFDILDEGYSRVKVPAIETKYVYRRRFIRTRPPLEIVPLMDLKNRANVRFLKRQIGRMRAWGWTYIPAGLAWGWRVLSPHDPYNQAADDDTREEKGIRRVVVLMTDGANTCRRYGRTAYVQCGVSSRVADRRMRRLCENIRDDGINIISVAYDVRNSRIRELMSECADMGYYEPRTGELQRVFREIAEKITKLYLSR
jgi:Mg-chelatase subunit ChlD